MEIIDHKFLITGHSFLPNDRDFGVVEMSLKKIIYSSFPKIIIRLLKSVGKVIILF